MVYLKWFNWRGLKKGIVYKGVGGLRDVRVCKVLRNVVIMVSFFYF